ncbi:hypothetical protein RI129_012352 [Pyrocoelia pectoralis]|uniref:Vitellinogen open beta-sheet domain-containing protein n=1 Tax=Pyrocoelia pectoralis TaxID=417401 RepID=A0AAN7ZC03_9COLE
MRPIGRFLHLSCLYNTFQFYLYNLTIIYSKCRSGCKGGNIDISLSSAEGQISNTKLKATVLLSQLSQCNQLLRLQNVQVIGPDAKVICPVDINTRKEGAYLIVQKSRNLNKCGHRESISQVRLAPSNILKRINYVPIGILLYLVIFYRISRRRHLTWTATSSLHRYLMEIILPSNESKWNFGLRVRHRKLPTRAIFRRTKWGESGCHHKIQFAGSVKESPQDPTNTPRSILFENPHMITTDQITSYRAKIGILSPGIVKHATPESLSAATTLLDQDIPREAYLGIGTLARRFCRQHACAKVDAVVQLVQKLDIQQDSEFRIKAYLVAAKCPTGKTANAVKALLDNEPSYQITPKTWSMRERALSTNWRNTFSSAFQNQRKRDVGKGDLDAMAKQTQIKTHELNKDLDIDFSVKLFGCELLFLSINDQTGNLSPNNLIDQIFDKLDEGIDEVKNLEKSVQSNYVFLDSEFSYPTSLGFPLRVSVEGTSSVQLKVATKIDIRSLMSSKQKLISVNHDIVFNTRELGKPEQNQPIKFDQNKDFSVCVDQLSPFIGLVFCADLNSPPTRTSHGIILPYPLAGNAKFSISIQREDLSHIHFSGTKYNEEGQKISLKLEGFVLPDTAYVRAQLITPINPHSPIVPLTVEGRVTYSNLEKSISVHVDRSNQQYLAKIGFTVSGNEQRSTYKPLIQYNVHYGALKTGSDLKLKWGGKSRSDYNLNFKVYGFDNKVEGHSSREVTNDKSKISNLLNVNGNKFQVDGTITHHCKRDDVNLGADLVIKIPGPNFVVGNGQLKVTKGTGTAFVVMDFVKFHRKFKVDSSFTVAEPQYNLLLTVYPNFEKDDNKLIFSTQNQVTSNFVDSKNFIEISGKKLEANLKTSSEGSINDGKQNGELEITLPTNHYFCIKFDRDHRMDKDSESGNLHIALEKRNDKNSPGDKLDIKGVLKDGNRDKGLYDLSYVISAESAKGKNINLQVRTKHQLQSEQHYLEGTGSAQLQKLDPVSGVLTYETSDSNLRGQWTMNYKKDKTIKVDLILAKPNEHEYHIDLKLDSPETPGTRLEIKSKESVDGKTLKNDVTLTTNQKKFTLANELVLSEIAPAFDIKLTYPSGKMSYNDFELNSEWDANLENIDNFVVKFKIHSPPLKFENVNLQVSNKPVKSGKKIQVTATSAGKNLLSGSTTYKVREEGDKYIVEGSGTFKIQDVSKQSNFKFIRQQLSSTKNGEDAIDAEFKATDKQFRIMSSYCEEKQQCAHIEIDSKTNSATIGEYNNELEVALDLRKLGLSHEFGLKGVTVRKGFVLDHNVDIYFQEKANKYQYSVYVHPNEAGAQLSTPKRMISLEGIPNQKSALSALLNCNDENKIHNCNGEIKFTNPSMRKDLMIKFNSNYDPEKLTIEQNMIIDVFANPHQQIVVSTDGLNLHLKYEGSLFDYRTYEGKYIDLVTMDVVTRKRTTGLTLIVDKEQALFNLKVCDRNLINAQSRLQINENEVTAKTNIDIVGVSPIESHLELTKPSTLKCTFANKGRPNEKFSIRAAYVPHQIAEVNMDFLQGGTKIGLASAYIKLDEKNFFKSDAKIHSENIKKHMLTPIRNDFSHFVKEIQSVTEAASKECSIEVGTVAEVLKNNAPNLQPLHDYYHAEFRKLHDEVVSDKTLKEIEDFLVSLFGAFTNSAQEVFGHMSEIVDNVVNTVQQQIAKTIEIMNKDLIPKLTEMVQTLTKVIANIFDQLFDLVFTYVAKIALIIEEHQEEINRFMATSSAVVQGTITLYSHIFPNRN